MGKTTVVVQTWGEIYGLPKTTTQKTELPSRDYLDTKQKRVPSKTYSSKKSQLKDKTKCLRCNEEFLSWDKKKNRVCPDCTTLNRKETRFSVYSGFDVVIPHQILESIIPESLQVKDAY